MVGTIIDHHKTVRDAISHKHKPDDNVLTSIAILEERLERLKKLSPQFAGISFSPAVAKLVTNNAVLA